MYLRYNDKPYVNKTPEMMIQDLIKFKAFKNIKDHELVIHQQKGNKEVQELFNNYIINHNYGYIAPKEFILDYKKSENDYIQIKFFKFDKEIPDECIIVTYNSTTNIVNSHKCSITITKENEIDQVNLKQIGFNKFNL